MRTRQRQFTLWISLVKPGCAVVWAVPCWRYCLGVISIYNQLTLIKVDDPPSHEWALSTQLNVFRAKRFPDKQRILHPEGNIEILPLGSWLWTPAWLCLMYLSQVAPGPLVCDLSTRLWGLASLWDWQVGGADAAGCREKEISTKVVSLPSPDPTCFLLSPSNGLMRLPHIAASPGHCPLWFPHTLWCLHLCKWFLITHSVWVWHLFPTGSPIGTDARHKSWTENLY